MVMYELFIYWGISLVISDEVFLVNLEGFNIV